MIEVLLVVLLVVLVVGFGTLAYVQMHSARPAEEPYAVVLEQQMAELMQYQQMLVGKVDTVSRQQVDSSKALTDSLSESQQQLGRALGERLGKVEAEMAKNLAVAAKDQAASLAGLTQRLETIDKAQDNIKALSEQVVSLQHVLDDNPARGAFGEVQLADIVESMLPSFAYTMQASLENGKQVDCLIELPDPPGPISVDAKFPLKAYQEMLGATSQADRDKAAKQLSLDTRRHIKDIADRYVGQPIDAGRTTAENALMFIPSEAVYGELHAHHPGVIEESHRRKVYLVSPTTLMATLTTVRAILRDVEMRKQASVIQREVGVLLTDIGRLDERVVNLERHFGQAVRDIDAIKTSSRKIASRGDKIEALDLGQGDDSAASLEAAVSTTDRAEASGSFEEQTPTME